MSKNRCRGRQRFGQRLAARLALLAMVLNLVSPAGFMPTSIGDSGWLMICPEGLPAGAFETPHDHHHHDHHHDSSGDSGGGESVLDSGPDHCSLGSALSAGSLLADQPWLALSVPRSLAGRSDVRHALGLRPSDNQARAPPFPTAWPSNRPPS